MRLLTRQNIEDILDGCVILGTGGGGELEEGMALINYATSLGKEFRLISLDEIPEEALLVTPYLLGALEFEDQDAYSHLPRASQEPLLLATNRMEKYMGQPIFGAIACEMGGSNTAAPMFIAAMKDGYIVDGDIAGRAVPEVTNSTYYIEGLPAAPIAVSNEFGEGFMIENIHDDERSEEVLRSISQVSRNTIAAVDHALPFSALKKALIPGTLSKALSLGETYRMTKQEGQNVGQAIAETSGGRIVFSGTVISIDWANVDGFTEGHVLIESGQDVMKIWFKNENLVAWLNDEVYMTLPDLICIFDDEKNTITTTPNFEKGMKVSVLVMDAPEPFKTEKGLSAFGPKRFGFDFDYMPALGRLI